VIQLGEDETSLLDPKEALVVSVPETTTQQTANELGRRLHFATGRHVVVVSHNVTLCALRELAPAEVEETYAKLEGSPPAMQREAPSAQA
jgi:hypothetical protein